MDIAPRLTQRFVLLCRTCAATPAVTLGPGALELHCPGCGASLSLGERRVPQPTPCACAAWPTALGEAAGVGHHPDCPRGAESVRVARITHDGTSLVDEDVSGALAALADGDDYAYQVELLTISRAEYDALPQFTGF